MTARVYAHPAMEFRHLHNLYATHGLKVRSYQGRTARHRWYLLVELVPDGGMPPAQLLRRAAQ
jgi:hypothetical protein